MKLPSLRSITRAYAMSFAFWCSIALLMGLQYHPLDRNHFWSWAADLLMGVALRAAALSFWTPPIFLLVGKYLPYSRRRFRYLFLWSLGAAPFVVLHTSILWALIPPYDDALGKYVSRSFQWWVEMIRGAFADQIFIYIAIVVAAHAYEYLKRLRREERERYEYQQALAASELQALKMQLHPHFLFNTLHGIATLIDGDPKSAKSMIIKLSNLLRSALDRDSSDLIPLQDELKFAREYLDLEKMRFGNRLKIDWQVATETLRFLVPQMILQPLVENAVRHGVASAREGGWVEVASSLADRTLTVKVRNSTTGQASNGTGVGLRNAEARLRYLYSGDAKLKFAIADDIATATLSLPALNSQPEKNGRGLRTQALAEDASCAFLSSTTNL